MLYGRREERDQITALLEGARGGHAGVLVVRGEAGIGKHTLLQDAAEHADVFHLLRCTGAEAEVELPFAALQQLLGPVLDRLDRLPAPQAQALQAAFGLVEPETKTNQFLVELGALSLLAVLAAEQPLLCLIGQARWLDAASADTLVFVARRLQAERLVVLFAARDGEARTFQAPGLPELRLGGLDPVAAGALLDAQVGTGTLAPQVRERLLAETSGNPLALLELPATLSSQQLAGSEPLPQRLPLSARLQQVFLERVRRLPTATQTLLLVAAAEDTGQLATILAAASVLGVDKEALEPAEQAGLVHVSGSQLGFRHPLVRSAIYQQATVVGRQAAHRALVEVLQGAQQADRRAWHLAAATLGPDEPAASMLEASADRARRRGGPAAAAAALGRAADLTVEEAARARRLVAAAEDLWEAGHTTQATALLNQAEPGSADLAVRARAAHLRGQIELATGTPAVACTLLVEGARLVVGSDPSGATELLVLAAQAALAANQLDRIVEEISPAIAHLPSDDARVKRVADSLVAAGLVQPAAPAQELPARAPTTWPPPALIWIWPMLIVADPAADDVTADQRYARSVAARRTARTIGSLTVALANLAMTETNLGRWPDAITTATEGLRLATETDQHANICYFMVLLAWIAEEQGRSQDCRQLADQAVAAATPLRLAAVRAYASWALAHLDLAEGRPQLAMERLLTLADPGHPSAHAPTALLATGELVEAAARAHALEGMEAHVARLERWANWTQQVWFLVTARRCRALISQGEDAERHYQAALGTQGIASQPLAQARTELAYGQWLRRGHRRVEARPHLRAALELFEQLGATPRAEQARTELRASGETARRRDPSTEQQLTPQERQVARLAGQGLSNQQIADRLFVSRHTVGYHLHKAYAKLNITSRAELGQLDLDDDDPR
jgi:DNA-binding CsgD family transcriptional regulator